MAVSPFIELPKDQFGHRTASTEWWWHIGTLRAGDRVLGFEITASGYPAAPTPFAISQIMLTDVANLVHYQQTTLFPFGDGFAQYDASQPWFVQLEPAGGDGRVAMTAIDGNPLAMHVEAGFTDKATGTPLSFRLQFLQNGEPLLVFGTGRSPTPAEGNEYNYYYSLTRLSAAGTVTIGDETLEVSGLTWMDHEYGGFPSNTMWILQNMQLDNGIHLMNFCSNTEPTEGKALESNASVLTPDGNSSYGKATCTPSKPWTLDGVTYFLSWQVEIPQIRGSFQVDCLMPDQVFSWLSPVYEGIASVRGSVDGVEVGGTAWIEQRLPKPGTPSLIEAVAASHRQ